ncbi:MAG: DUF3987 domain-containing protein [Rhodomicrobium sp.]
MTSEARNGNGHDHGNGTGVRRARYARSALLGEKNALANTKEGRNNRACAAARRLGNLIGANLLSFTECESALIDACRRNGLMTEDPKGTAGTIRSNLKAGILNPDYLGSIVGPPRNPRRPKASLPQENKAPEQIQAERAKARRKAEALERGHKWWAESQKLDGTLAGRYFTETRNLPLPEPHEARFHPAIYGRDTHGARPGILFPIAPAPGAKPIGYHRIFLEHDKPEKARIASPKQILGAQEGGAVWFGDPACETLLITEGIENNQACLAAGYRFGAAAVSSGNLSKIPLPPHVTEIILAADWGADGEKFARRAASIFRAQERSVLLSFPPKARSEQGKWQDWNDLHRSEGPAAVRAALDAARAWRCEVTEEEEADWPELLSYEDAEGSQPYPIGALPAGLRAAIQEVAAYVKTPIAMAATSALSALSLASQGLADVERDTPLKGPVGLYSLVLADSGERKTTLDSFFLRAIRQYEAEARQKAQPGLEAFEAKLAAWKAEKEGLEGAIRQAAKESQDLTRLKERFEEHYLAEPAAPRMPRLLRGDSTSEALAFSLAKHWPSAGILQSEAGLFLGSHAMGPEKIMAALSLLNSFWDGSDYTAERRSTESFTVLKPRLTVALQLQEPALRAFCLSRGELPRGIGFFARFLFARPKSAQGTRTYAKAPQTWPALSAFERRLIALLESTKQLDENGMLQLSMLTLDEAAEAQWTALYDRIELDLAEGRRYYDVRDVAAKAADNIARLAALFHLFEHGPHGRISAATIDAAGLIVLWHLNEARRFFGDFARPAEFVAARELEEWLLRRVERAPGPPPSLCSVQQLVTPKYLRRRKALDEAVQALTELGRARLRSDGKQKFIEIRPSLLNPGTAL